MGRELMRVPLDFDWPLHMIWKGYWSPYQSQKCAVCNGKGTAPVYRALYDAWYGFENDRPKGGEALEVWEANFKWVDKLEQDEVNHLCDKDRLVNFCCDWRVPNFEEWDELERERRADARRRWLRQPWSSIKEWVLVKLGRKEIYKPDPERPRHMRRRHQDRSLYYPPAELVNANAVGMLGGHDSINHWIAVDYRARKLGIPEDEWYCKFCDGEGRVWFSKKHERLAERWYEHERYDPPNGPGFQLWETVSEGSPISPVFATGEEMIEYLIDELGFNREASIKFVEETGWAPSMITTRGKVLMGIDALMDD